MIPPDFRGACRGRISIISLTPQPDTGYASGSYCILDIGKGFPCRSQAGLFSGAFCGEVVLYRRRHHPFARKIVCQRRTFRPSFGNLQSTGNRIFSREIETLFAGIHFPRFLQKQKGVFAEADENEKRNARHGERAQNYVWYSKSKILNS